MDSLLQYEVIWRLLLAAVLGAALGVERSLAGKHAGMRTYALVALGSCLFVVNSILSAFALSMFPSANPVYIAASVVVGIGFIGAGLATMRAGEKAGPELTTATGIWLSAGIGMSVGFGFYAVSISATIFGLLIFWILAKVEHALRVRFTDNLDSQ